MLKLLVVISFIVLLEAGCAKEEIEVNTREDIADSELLVVVENSKYGVIDKNGNKIIDYKYDEILSFSDGLARIKEWGLYG